MAKYQNKKFLKISTTLKFPNLSAELWRETRTQISKHFEETNAFNVTHPSSRANLNIYSENHPPVFVFEVVYLSWNALDISLQTFSHMGYIYKLIQRYWNVSLSNGKYIGKGTKNSTEQSGTMNVDIRWML